MVQLYHTENIFSNSLLFKVYYTRQYMIFPFLSLSLITFLRGIDHSSLFLVVLFFIGAWMHIFFSHVPFSSLFGTVFFLLGHRCIFSSPMPRFSLSSAQISFLLGHVDLFFSYMPHQHFLNNCTLKFQLFQVFCFKNTGVAGYIKAFKIPYSIFLKPALKLLLDMLC